MERIIVSFERVADFEEWLEEHHDQNTGIWLLIAKKGSGRSSVTYQEALECALCYGWIDGQKAKHDDLNWLQYFSKRKKNSLWSQTNRDKVQVLRNLGRMKAPGEAAVEEAMKSGQWDSAYQPISSRAIPEDFEAALDSNKQAKAFFETLGSQNRYSFVFRISTAKNPETRKQKIADFVRMLENGEVFHPKK